jgi:serine/threonine-protein kinase
LAYAHAQGVIHRDLKPANVILQRNGVLRLSDFGLARSLLSGGLTREGEILGTPRYMPPEQLLGSQVDHRADIYAFGCIAYELLAGTPPFDQRDVLSLLRQHMQRKSVPSRMMETVREAGSRPLSHEVQTLLDDSLATDPNDRCVDLASVANWSADVDPHLLQQAAIARAEDQSTVLA